MYARMIEFVSNSAFSFCSNSIVHDLDLKPEIA